jgi:prefoldin alpha subunit
VAAPKGSSGAASADKPAPPTEEQLRELVMHGEQLRQQLAALDQQRELIAELAGDARRALASLEYAATAKDGDEILVPLGAGAFVHARIASAGRALASLGAGVHAEMPATDARDRLKARVESLETALSKSGNDAAHIAEELERVNRVLEPYMGGA